MAIFPIVDQYLTKNMGPLDSKMLVKTFDDLTNKDTWMTDGKLTAYNGMLVAVWLNKKDTSKNGVYILNDPNITSTLKYEEKLDVTKSEHWHKLAEVSDLAAIIKDLSSLQSELDSISGRLTVLENLEAEEKVHTFGYRKDFPVVGQLNHMYIAIDQHRTYVFVGGSYLPIADQFEYTDHDENPETPEVRILHGGSAVN